MKNTYFLGATVLCGLVSACGGTYDRPALTQAQAQAASQPSAYQATAAATTGMQCSPDPTIFPLVTDTKLGNQGQFKICEKNDTAQTQNTIGVRSIFLTGALVMPKEFKQVCVIPYKIALRSGSSIVRNVLRDYNNGKIMKFCQDGTITQHSKDSYGYLQNYVELKNTEFVINTLGFDGMIVVQQNLESLVETCIDNPLASCPINYSMGDLSEY
jgi:hypothetical protein